MFVAGREFSDVVLDRIRARVASDAGLTRTGLSREVGAWLDWRGSNGGIKEMNCRVALLRLWRRGVIELPGARTTGFGRAGGIEQGQTLVPLPVVAMTLAELGQVELLPVAGVVQSRQWRALLGAHHPLGAGPLCGAQLRYLIHSPAGVLGGMSFSAAAWRLAARDAWIGWDDATRQARLCKVVANSRFLILPSVTVPNLASHVLALAAARLPADWQARYGFAPVLLETFVDRSRYRGTCYRAANWLALGSTTGRGRQDRGRTHRGGAKDIFVLPLQPNWQAQLNLGSAVVTLPCDHSDWAGQEFGRCILPDARLRKRVLTLARDFYAQPSANLPQACGSRAATKAAYRFFAHPKTSMQTLLQSHYHATATRLRQAPVVLAVQDSTSLNYSTHETTTGIGPIGTTVDGPQGLHLHSTLAFTPDGVPLGFIDVQCWARDPANFGKKARRKQLPIEQKESAKWLRSYRATATLQATCDKTRMVSVGDREADLYELFSMAAQAPAPDLLVRARHDRKLDGEPALLRATVQAQPVAGMQTLLLPRQGSRSAREAQLAIRYASVRLLAPKTLRQQCVLTVSAVLAEEINTPEGVPPLQWLLLTTLPVNDIHQAIEKLQWYACRWGIEVFHRTLKSGCRIEQRQLGTAERLQACLAIDLVVAWRIHHLTKLGRTVPQAPCSVYFEEPQWKALMVFTTKNPTPPEKPPTLRDAIHRVAGLGGFLGRKSDGEPGTQTLWRGLQRLDDITEIWQVMRDATQRRVSSRRESG